MQAWNEVYESKFEHTNMKNFDIFKILINTKNLILKPISNNNAKDLFESYDIEISKYMYYSPCLSLLDAEKLVNRSVEWMRKSDRIVFSIYEKNTMEFIWCFWVFNFDTTTPELWFIWVKKSKQNMWFLSEASLWVIKWLSENIDFRYVVCFIDENNKIWLEIIKDWWAIKVWKLPPMLAQDWKKSLIAIEFRIYREHLINLLGI